ncbi:hypothetical protein KEM56_003075 [Ascosphaera pollenicola]|nr:hypothetical protein KEM56_003075 [Ascosphaera pollenicola]
MPILENRSSPLMNEEERLVNDQKDAHKVTVPDVVKLGHDKLKYDYHKLVNGQSYDDQERWKNETSQGKEVVEDQERQHEEIKQLVCRFQKISPADQQFLPTLEFVTRLIQAYIQSEEKSVLLPIERTLPIEESEKRAKKFERKKHHLPTRIHPSRGYHWIYTDIEAIFESPTNRIGDLGRKFPRKSTRHRGSFNQIKREKQAAR